VNPTQGIKYAPGDEGYFGGRGMSPMGGVSALTNPLPPPPLPKNGTAEDITGDGEINATPQGNPLTEDYNTQPIPDQWPGA
jgi:hypothetical protein